MSRFCSSNPRNGEVWLVYFYIHISHVGSGGGFSFFLSFFAYIGPSVYQKQYRLVVHIDGLLAALLCGV